MPVKITGTNFTGASAVTIGGVPATSFTVTSSTEISAVTPVTVSGSISVTAPGGTANRAGFIYVPTSEIITDFNGFWRTNAASPTAVQPDNSHHLLAFTHNGITYSTGVNNAVLTNNSINFTPATFKALPVAAIAGLSNTSISTYLALASKVDGSAASAYIAGAASYTIKQSLIDGINGLNLGTGVTNLPSSAVMTFQIYNIDAARATDPEPDIILTQIASPSASNDVFTFLDGAGNPVGTPFTQDMTLLPKLGTYMLDLFNTAGNIPYNVARPFSVPASGTNTLRDIRVVTLNLSDFGINALNASSVKALRITPSGNSDYAFIGYNAASVNLPPNAALSTETSVSRICTGGTASLEIVGTPAQGGALTYVWEESSDGGSSWHTVVNGGNYSGATTERLIIANATVGYRYRATVNEAGNGNAGISGAFTITAAAGTPPTSVVVAGGISTCVNSNVQLTSTVTGGTNLSYQWQNNASGSFADIPGATAAIEVPVTAQTGSVDYRLVVSPGSGCPGTTSNTINLTVTGISSVTPAERCGTGPVTLNATATSGVVTWYSVESGGSGLLTANSFPVASLSATTTYYAAAPGCTQRVPVTATVYPASAAGSVTTIPGSSPNTTILTLSSQTGLVQKWQSSTDNFNAAITDIASTQSQLVVSNPVLATRYRAVVQSGTCAAVNSSLSASVVLPIRANSLKLTPVGSAILLSWETYDQDGALHYEVERSYDGTDFTTLASVPLSSTLKYQWQDNNPGTGAIQYRVKEKRINGDFTYSNTAFIRLGGDKGIVVYPNPVKDNVIGVQLNNAEAGKYHLLLHNATGQAIYNGSFNYPGGLSRQTITLPGKLPPGIYRLTLTDATGKRTQTTLLFE